MHFDNIRGGDIDSWRVGTLQNIWSRLFSVLIVSKLKIICDLMGFNYIVSVIIANHKHINHHVVIPRLGGSMPLQQTMILFNKGSNFIWCKSLSHSRGEGHHLSILLSDSRHPPSYFPGQLLEMRGEIYPAEDIIGYWTHTPRQSGALVGLNNHGNWVDWIKSETERGQESMIETRKLDLSEKDGAIHCGHTK